jgi:hypothetical protein
MASKRYERSGCLALSRQLARGLQDKHQVLTLVRYNYS